MKQLIKGIDILLYSGGTAETVSNVLVGNPASSGTAELPDSGGTLENYTLAIPKGDTHNWINRTVEFFGKKFRTVGIPLQGIEENIPLFWHKQVNVQRLDISGDCTLYEKDTYTRHLIKDVFIHDSRGTQVMLDGMAVNGALSVHIYADTYRADTYKPKPGDIVVPSDIDFVFDTTSQQTVSESMKQFRQLYDYAAVHDVKEILYGTLPDYIITSS